MEKVDQYARVIWDYMLMHQELRPAEIIVVFGSNDVRVAKYATELFNRGYGKYILFSGGFGKSPHFTESEAKVFSKIAIEQGVPEDKILIEDKAASTGENVLFTKKLLQERNLNFKSFIFVQKPYMERRMFVTLKKQWSNIEFVVTSPEISYEDYSRNFDTSNSWINVMVGDLQRIKEYPNLGFQIEQNIPEEVWQAGQELIKLGYTKYLLK